MSLQDVSRACLSRKFTHVRLDLCLSKMNKEEQCPFGVGNAFIFKTTLNNANYSLNIQLSPQHTKNSVYARQNQKTLAGTTTQEQR